MAKKPPTGFVAICQCGATVGAMDSLANNIPEVAGRILGKWLSSGCTVQPRFESTWKANIEPCRCGD